MLGGKSMVAEYRISKRFALNFSSKHVVPLGVIAVGVYLKKYTAKRAIGKNISN